MLQTWILGITGAVVLWYTWETHQLRRVALRQIDVQLRPFVILRQDLDNQQFLLENVSKVVALNVRVRPSPISLGLESKFELRFEPEIPLLRPGAAVAVRGVGYVGDQRAGDFFGAHIDPRYAKERMVVHIDYQNVEGTPYSAQQEFGPGLSTLRGMGPSAV